MDHSTEQTNKILKKNS